MFHSKHTIMSERDLPLRLSVNLSHVKLASSNHPPSSALCVTWNKEDRRGVIVFSPTIKINVFLFSFKFQMYSIVVMYSTVVQYCDEVIKLTQLGCIIQVPAANAAKYFSLREGLPNCGERLLLCYIIYLVYYLLTLLYPPPPPYKVCYTLPSSSNKHSKPLFK